MKSLKEYINESYGEFKDGYEICSEIYDSILKQLDTKNIKIDTSSYLFSDIHINSIDFIFTGFNYNTFSYDASKTNHDTNDITIYVNFSNILEYNKKICIKLILHEITHAIQDICLNKLGEDLCKYKSNKYEFGFTKFIRVANDIFLNKENEIEDTYKLNSLYYLLNPAEQNAYLSELKSDIFEILDNYNLNTRFSIDYNKLLELIKKNNIWKAYFICKTVIDKLNSTNDYNLIENIYYSFNQKIRQRNKNIDILVLDSFVKSTKKSWDKFEDKFNKFIPKICAEYYETHVANN